jgi:chemotaxis protein MotA
MFVIVGILIVVGSIVGGYLMEHGQLLVLFQPAELVIIAGSALGTALIANPVGTLMKLVKNLAGLLAGSRYDTVFYLENLRMLNDLFSYARKNGMPKLEMDVDEPEKSPLFSKYPRLLQDRHALDFICDTFRVYISGGVDPFDLDQMMELDMEVHHNEALQPASALASMADALPGLGIVAAVLGVVITMGAIGGPPEEIGRKVAAALVGTFLGVLLCYGFVGPIGLLMTRQSEREAQYLHFLRVGILAFLKGSSPMTAAEFARRTIPSSMRPSFVETERACRGGPVAGAAAAA